MVGAEGVGYPEFYSHLMDNESTSYGILTLKYFETELYSKQYAVLDGGRYFTPTPTWGNVGNRWKGGSSYGYKFFILDSLDYVLHQFLYQEENEEERWARDRLLRCVLLYKNELEKNLFEEYVEGNIQLLIERTAEEKESSEWLPAENRHKREYIQENIIIGKILKKLLTTYRKEIGSFGQQ